MAPSGPVQAGRLDAGLAVLRGWGLEPVVYPHVRDVGEVPYLAADDGGRASDVEEAWCDASIAAVLSARGGFGAQRIVELLDWERTDAAVAAARLAATWSGAEEAFRASKSGRNLMENAPELEADIPFCARESVLDVVPRLVALRDGAAEISL